ncbi:MAG: hypothetical protein ABR591_07365 [Candidatus Velthaea sp.]
MPERTDGTREERIPAERGNIDTRTSDTRDGVNAPRIQVDRDTEMRRVDSSASAGTAARTEVSRSAETRSRDRSADADVDLLGGDALMDFRSRWERLQVRFVDEPREAVQSAHDLVGEVVDRLSQGFTRQREGLEGSWSRGEDDTEALRQALQRYRSFFNRLLST